MLATVIEKYKWCNFMFVQQGPSNIKDSDSARNYLSFKDIV